MVVFIHGLWGDPKLSFLAEGVDKNWPMLMSEDKRVVDGQFPLSAHTYIMIGFPAAIADSLSVEEISRRVITDLEDFGAFNRYGNIYIVAHSMGGLVTKSVLVKLKLRQPGSIERVAAVFLISTPSQGAPAADFLKMLPRIVTGSIVPDLGTVASNTYLDSLESNWTTILQQRTTPWPAVFCAYETKSTAIITVVPKVFTATRCDQDPRPEPKNHIDIVKPVSMNDSIYEWVRGRIAETGKARSQFALKLEKESKNQALSRGGQEWKSLERIPQSETVTLAGQSILVSVVTANSLWKFCELKISDKSGARRVRFQRAVRSKIRIGDWRLSLVLKKVSFIPTVCFFDVAEER